MLSFRERIIEVFKEVFAFNRQKDNELNTAGDELMADRILREHNQQQELLTSSGTIL